MIFRLHEYLVAIWRHQIRTWEQQHRSLAGLSLQPIAPLVLYTGARPWPTLESLANLMEMGNEFQVLTPTFTPLFVNLPELSMAALEAGGAFGRVLELIQQRRARPEEFQALLEKVVNYFQSMSVRERSRWLELLSYLDALVYHEREPGEQARLREVIVASARTSEQRRQLEMARRTMADEMREEGVKLGRQQESIRRSQQILIRQLECQLGPIPEETRKLIKRTRELAQLNEWLERVVKARNWDEMGMTSTS